MINGEKLLYGLEGQKNGCNFYRVQQPIKACSETNTFLCGTTSQLNGSEYEMYLAQADIIMTQSFISDRFVEFMNEQKGKKQFWLDFDDNIYAVSPLNPSYQFHGTKEVNLELPGGQIVQIKDGEKGFDIERNREKIKLFSHAIRMADIVTTPSTILAKVFKRFNRNVRVIKNFIDPSIWYPLNLVKDETIRIGWQGGWSHCGDFFEAKEALEFVFNRHKNLKLVVMGQFFEGALSGIPEDRIEKQSWINMDAYPYKFKTLNIDIGIAPLEDNEFNNCKSELKWEEYSALAIPTIASNVPPYSLAINHNQTGFLCSNKNEWIEALELLISSQNLRKEMGETARAHILEHYDIYKNLHLYKNAYDSLSNKEILIAKR